MKNKTSPMDSQHLDRLLNKIFLFGLVVGMALSSITILVAV